MFIRLATSEFSGSMITRYPDQSSLRFVVPQTTQFSPSTTRWQSRQTFPCFFLFAGGMLLPLALCLLRRPFLYGNGWLVCFLFLLVHLFFEPERSAKSGLPHRKSDLAVAWFPFIQGEGHDTDADNVPNPDKAFGFLADETCVLLIVVDVFVRDLAHVQHRIDRPEADECPETCRFDNNSFYYLLQREPEHHRFKLDIVIDTAVTGYEFAFPDVLHLRYAYKYHDLFIDTALELLLQDIEYDFFEFFAQPLGWHPDFILKHQFMVHTSSYLRNISSFFCFLNDMTLIPRAINASLMRRSFVTTIHPF